MVKGSTMGSLYETDLVAWARQQAALLRRGALSGELSSIDALNIAEEIEDVGRSAHRELGNRLSVLIAHLLKWKFQPDLRSKSWRNTLIEQRSSIVRNLRQTPSLKHDFDDEEWQGEIWADAAVAASRETGLEFPTWWIWTIDQVLDPGFFPE
jgi:hypothetical protein